MDSYEKKQLKYKFIFSIIATFCIAVVISASATFYYVTKRYADAGLKVNKTELTDSSDTIKAISSSLETFKSVIDKYYIGEIDNEKVLNETIKGYVNGLGDKYSEYYTKEEWDEFQESALGNYYGIGIYMSQNEDNNIVIASTIKGGPAEEAGLQAEDIIVSIDDQDFLGKKPEDASKLIKGKEGGKVKLKIARGNEYKEFEVERREVKIYHVESEMLENNVGYISLLTFDEGCADELKTAIEDLKSKGANKYILDLRYNTGGYLHSVTSMINMFLPKGKTIYQIADKKNTKKYTATTDESRNYPIAVLVNNSSASASEILAISLKESYGAYVVGTNTYGKGTVQTTKELKSGGMIKYTIQKWLSPKGNWINEKGVTPTNMVLQSEEYEKNPTLENDEQLQKAIDLLGTTK